MMMKEEFLSNSKQIVRSGWSRVACVGEVFNLCYGKSVFQHHRRALGAGGAPQLTLTGGFEPAQSGRCGWQTGMLVGVGVRSVGP